MTEEFFEDKQGPAVLKHAILKRYLTVFASKTGSTSKDRRVGYLDGYAGPGMYTDGSPGSPVLALTTAQNLASIRTLEGVYIEQDSDSAEALSNLLAGTNHTHHVLKGAVTDKLDEALAKFDADQPLFAFFDPFGLPLSMKRIHDVLARGRVSGGRRTGPATEVLINFMYPAIRRVAGQLTANGTDPTYLKARETMIANMDDKLGGSWWQQTWLDSKDMSAEDRCRRIAVGYLKKLTEGLNGAWGWSRVQVSRRWDGPTLYELLFITLYPEEGLWEFAQAASSGYEDFLKFCIRGELDMGQVASHDARLIGECKASISELLEQGEFKVSDKYSKLLTASVGLPREKHLRAAIKQLYKEGKTKSNGVGPVRKMLIAPW